MNTLRAGALTAGILTIWLAAASAGEPLVVESPKQRVALLELYTSEGCSSCPPADRWVSSLQDRPGLWRRFIPLAFHVDYWDYIGWPDRFASPDYTARQYRHASEQAMRTVYTPGFFLNGREWRWRRGDLESSAPVEPVGVLSLEVTDAGVNLRFEGEGGEQALSASVAVLGFGIETQVRAGENAGRTLSHDFIVLSVDETKMRRTGDAYTAKLSPPTTDVDAEHYAIAAWVSPQGSQIPIQAAGGWWDLM